MDARIRELQEKLDELTEELWELRKSTQPEPVDDHELMSQDGPVRLSTLFGDAKELLVIHNMGESCSYCTLWADSLASSVRPIETRCPLVLVSPDAPQRQAEIKAERGWPYQMVSDQSRAFSTALGFYREEQGWWPGVSAFTRNEEGKILRTNWTHFGPGDSFAAVFHFFSLLPGGVGDWEPGG